MRPDLLILILIPTLFIILFFFLFKVLGAPEDNDTSACPFSLSFCRNANRHQHAQTGERPRGKFSKWWQRIFGCGETTDGDDGMDMKTFERDADQDENHNSAPGMNTADYIESEWNDHIEEDEFGPVQSQPVDTGIGASSATSQEPTAFAPQNIDDGQGRFQNQQPFDEDDQLQREADNRLVSTVNRQARYRKRGRTGAQSSNQGQKVEDGIERNGSLSSSNPFSDDNRIED